jgi:PTH1 family peptidyl-tRNA hydrolase
MILIVGLGNPPKKYQKTRHNIGSRIISELHSPSTSRLVRATNRLKSFNLENVVLAKPTTFMNESGKAVKALLRIHRLKPDNLIVIHDDIDLPLGKIRIAKNRGAAGHKGVESITKELSTKNFIRLRIGICPKSGKPRNPEKFVLQEFHRGEERAVKEIIKKAAEAINSLIKEGLEKTMSRFNK